MDYNQLFDFGDYENGVITVVNEIPMGSRLKIEWDRKNKAMVLDRVEPYIAAKPCNYGFIPKTLDDDGDELDVLLIVNEPVPTGIVVEARIIGVMNFDDGGEMDHKVIAVPTDDRDTGNAYETYEDLPPNLIKQLEHHFNHYKDLKKPGTTNVQGFAGIDDAKKVIAECIERWKSEA